MSNYLHLDSFFRNIETYPNPANYAIETSDLVGFNAEARTVRGRPAPMYARAAVVRTGPALWPWRRPTTHARPTAAMRRSR